MWQKIGGFWEKICQLMLSDSIHQNLRSHWEKSLNPKLEADSPGPRALKRPGPFLPCFSLNKGRTSEAMGF